MVGEPVGLLVAADESLRPAAAALAERFGLRLADSSEGQSFPIFILRTSGLEARLGDGDRGRVLQIDFTDAALERRARQARGEAVVRAVAAHSISGGLVCDATAGLGVDSFLLVHAGFDVIAIERHGGIAAMLCDGVNRAGRYPELRALFEARLRIVHADARAWLQGARRGEYERPDVVYLDPMFAAREGAALVRGAMRDLRAVVGDDAGDAALLDAALDAARRRVVVKRMHDAPPIAHASARVHHELRDGVVRFDVYEITR